MSPSQSNFWISQNSLSTAFNSSLIQDDIQLASLFQILVPQQQFIVKQNSVLAKCSKFASLSLEQDRGINSIGRQIGGFLSVPKQHQNSGLTSLFFGRINEQLELKNKAKQFSHGFFVQHLPDWDKEQNTKERQSEYKQIFNNLDKDGSGYIDIEELQVALHRLGLPSSDEFVEDILERFDEDKNCKIDLNEFQNYMMSKENQMRQTFLEIDLDHSGAITQKELYQYFQSNGLHCVSPEDTHKMIKMLDTNNDKKVDYQEFVRYLLLLPSVQLHTKQVVVNWADSSDWVNMFHYRMCMIPPWQTSLQLLAGGMAGVISRTATAPIERLRNIVMTDPEALGIVQSTRKMWADGGFFGLFKGNFTYCLKVFPQSAVQFACYDEIKKRLSRQGAALSDGERIFAGMVAGFVSGLVTHPMDLIRTRSAIGIDTGNVFQNAAKIVHTQGVIGLYQGVWAESLVTSLQFGLSYASYDICQQIYSKRTGHKPHPDHKVLLGATTAALVSLLVQPMVTVAKMMIVNRAPGQLSFNNMFHCYKYLYVQQGTRGLYRGLGGSLIKIVPQMTVLYLVQEWLAKQWAIGGLRVYRQNQ